MFKVVDQIIPSDRLVFILRSSLVKKYLLAAMVVYVRGRKT